MNDETRFILRRIEAVEGRIMNELREMRREVKELQAWKNRALGVIVTLSGLTSFVVSIILKK